MLAVLSPAKTLDFETPAATRRGTQPEFLGEARLLAGQLRKLSADKLAELMSISDRLAGDVREYFDEWRGEGKKPALLAFQGDVYQGLEAGDFSAEDLAFAQDHLRILSGLYGLLRPLDRIEPYRLEMGTKLATPRGKTLYDFWGDRLTMTINRALAKRPERVLVNLASNEYFSAIAPKQLDARIVTPSFKDYKGGTYKIVSFFAKKARGQMARFLVKNRLTDPQELKDFRAGGYRFNQKLSDGDNWVFTRKQPSR